MSRFRYGRRMPSTQGTASPSPTSDASAPSRCRVIGSNEDGPATVGQGVRLADGRPPSTRSANSFLGEPHHRGARLQAYGPSQNSFARGFECHARDISGHPGIADLRLRVSRSLSSHYRSSLVNWYGRRGVRGGTRARTRPAAAWHRSPPATPIVVPAGTADRGGCRGTPRARRSCDLICPRTMPNRRPRGHAPRRWS